MIQLAALAGGLAMVAGCRSERTEVAETVRIDTLAYVGRASCASCHQEAYQHWQGSDHDRAMDVATDATVLGDFDDASFRNCGVTTRFFRDGEAFRVRTAGPDGQMADYTVTHTFGVRPLQQYLVTFPDGRLQALTVAWDVEQERWFSLYADECVPPDDVLHWTRPAMNWNYMCADCHSTGLQRNFQLESNRYQTTFAEIDVSCEACHGPAELHVAWAEDEPVPQTPGPYGLTIDLSPEAPQQNEIDACAPCHSRRRVTFPDYVPGADYLDHYEPALLEEDLYFPDGQIQDEVYVYGSFTQSRMHANGVRCSNCHDPHSTRTVLPGNRLCTQCHAAATYDVEVHVRHPGGTEAAACVSCHMPERTYMVVDPRRDHGFRVPRPDLTAEFGVPNACNGCHTDQSAQWAAEAVREWYGETRRGSAPFARAFAAGRAGRPEAEPELRGIVADTARGDIVRASALQLLRAYDSDETRAAARAALADESALVRTIAVRSIGDRVQPRQAANLLMPLVRDSSRLVRMEAARVLTLVEGSTLTRNVPENEAFWDALAEYREGQLAVSEQPAAHLNLAVAHEGLGEWDEATAAYRTALRLDSNFVAAHVNLAMLYDRQRAHAVQTGRAADADSLYRATEAALRTAIRIQPEMPETHYSLGLLLAENPETMQEAVRHLDRAASLAPHEARIRYNAGIAHQHIGELRAAEEHLLAAYQIDPGSDDFLNALSVLYLQQGRIEDALPYTTELAQRYPQNPEFQQRLNYITQHRPH